MITGILRGLICAIGLFLSLPTQARADVDIYWDFDDGFSPSTVEINAGESVTWWNSDLFGFDVNVTINNSLSFFLNDGTGQQVTFPDAGTYSFQSDFGDNGSVTVNPLAPPGILLESPRKEAGLFLFEATGLTVGKTNLVQASTNLVAWTAIKTNIATSTSMTFTNPATLPQRFFRVLELP